MQAVLTAPLKPPHQICPALCYTPAVLARHGLSGKSNEGEDHAAAEDDEIQPFSTDALADSDTRRDAIAYAAMVLSFLAFLPSFVLIIRNRSACNISVTAIVVRALGSCLWLYFALANEIKPSIIASAIGLGFTLVFLGVVMGFQSKCK